MAVTTTLAPQFEAALVTALQARVGLAGVYVDSGTVGDIPAKEYIEIGGRIDPGPRAESLETWGAIGNLRKEETVTFHCLIYVQVTGSGGAGIRAAGARAHELLAEVATQLRDDPDMGDLVRVTELGDWTEQTFVGSGTRASVLLFDIRYTASLPRT